MRFLTFIFLCFFSSFAFAVAPANLSELSSSFNFLDLKLALLAIFSGLLVLSVISFGGILVLRELGFIHHLFPFEKRALEKQRLAERSEQSLQNWKQEVFRDRLAQHRAEPTKYENPNISYLKKEQEKLKEKQKTNEFSSDSASSKGYFISGFFKPSSK